ncbi:uncharacterized protein [Spinacia oleracea]|uniref:Retrotransposon gag domain-containing protein n=1 Tax=Spinacia oleracea TaxID=3562 RepID=A0ABM3RJ85_SPIOL|nr:uncharacterized protein LOC130470114 [Spinacia oleracea]XP_056695687.1 uncharacterized protein LOC130470114 [Spinacia oleracea]XP_056699578.1 uncharacterized protein LOC110781682 [Spinacia oleracea]
MFERLARVKPPYFKGQSDLTFLENRIREFEKQFEAVSCPMSMRVGQAVLYLKDEADLWWRENETRLSTAERFNWDSFVVALREKFYPPFITKRKAQEFINLGMGSMTIAEYYSKFIALSKFTPEVVAIEEIKAQMFEQGLTDEIQLELGGETFIPLENAYERTAHIHGLQSRRDKKNVVGEKRKEFDAGKNRGNFKKNRNVNRNESGNGNFQGRSNQGHHNNSNQSKRVHHCKMCSSNHPGKNCNGELVTCNYCQKRGHREYECFTKHRKEQNSNKAGNQVRFNQSGGQNSKPGGAQNNQENYNKPANDNNNPNKAPGKLYMMNQNEDERSADIDSGGEFSVGDF